MIIPILSLILFMNHSIQAKENTYFLKEFIFGTDIRVESVSKTAVENYKKEISSLKKEAKIFLDPDCKWRRPQEPCKNPFTKRTKQLEKMARKFSQETMGIFQIRANPNAKRDFAGLSQGFFIDQIRGGSPAVIDFSGDIFFTGGFESKIGFTIGDPLLPSIPYGKVFLKSGWMITSGSKRLGSNVYMPKTAKMKLQEDFLQITLFAKPAFSGARLDAWATALVLGGKPLLNKLWELPKYRAQWAYFYFDSKGYPHCSQNIDCKLKRKNKVLKVDWDSTQYRSPISNI